MDSPHSTPNSRRGFALLITITLLAFLVILLVGLGIYVRVETSIAGNTQRQMQARQNALVGLNVAVSQLQKFAGPDTRVTATGEVPGGARAQNLTGVWDTNAAAGSPAMTWLVSRSEQAGADPDQILSSALNPATEPTANQALLVGNNSLAAIPARPTAAELARRIKVNTLPITSPGVPGVNGNAQIGRYGWWVGDQGVKAPVAVADPTALSNVAALFDTAPYATTESRRRIRQQLSLGAGATTAAGTASLFEPRDATNGSPTNAAAALNTTALNQLSFFRTISGGTVGLANVQANFHTWSPNNANVLASTNPASAGLRRDLSLRPDLLGAGFTAWANYNPTRGGYMEDPTTPLTPEPLPTYSTDPVRRRYRMTARTEENGIEHRIGPVLSFFGLGFSIRNDASTPSTELQVSARCVVGLWNPYTSALVPEDLELVVQGLPRDLVVRNAQSGAEREVSLENGFAGPTGEVKFALPFTPNTDPADPSKGDADRSSWLPGRVYNWSLPSMSIDLPQSGIPMQFYTRSAVVGSGGFVRPAGPPLGTDTTKGTNFREVQDYYERTLTVELRRASNGEVIGRFRSPRFDPFITSKSARSVDALSDDFAYVFRLPDRTEKPLNEQRAWLEAAGRDPREFQFPVNAQEGYVVAGNDPQPAALINLGATSFDASYPQLLLDRYTNSVGHNYNEDVPVFELPRGPILSLGSLQHLFIRGERPFAVGNSWGGARNAWFDQYFFSGLTADSGWGDQALLDQPIDFVSPKLLPNPLLRPVRRKADGTATRHMDIRRKDPLLPNDPPLDAFSSKHLLQNGSFNVNSLSIPAWAAVLRGVRFATPAANFTFLNASSSTGTSADTTTTLPEPFLTNSRSAGFPRFAQSAQETFVATDGYLQSEPATPATNVVNTPLFRRGIRFLNAAQVGTLADKIVALVRQKQTDSGPFLTIEQFISASPLFLDATGNQMSLLEKAIDDAQLNTDAALGLTTTTGQFSSQWLTQADVLTALAPVLFTRSDTFVVRAYGESINPASGLAEGKAWCEAIVQRTPEYFDPSDPAETAPLSLTVPLNQANGRRFKVVSFRWLTRSDI